MSHLFPQVVLQSYNIINLTVKLFLQQPGPLTLTMILKKKKGQKQITVEHDRDHHSADEDESCDEELNVVKDAEGEVTFLSENVNVLWTPLIELRL